MTESYDAIVVGARCAGSPTAMLLARKGYRVLVVDRATFPSDTVSTHMVHAPGVAALQRWGLREQLEATGCPPIDNHFFDFGPFTISGTPRPVDGVSTGFAPRRTVLDKLLVDAALEAGAEVWEGFAVDEIVMEGAVVVGIRGRDADGNAVDARARVVIGADGRNSRVAKAVQPEQYHEKPILQQGSYTYWSGLPVDGFEVTIRPDRGWAAFPTHDDLTLVVVGWPYAEHAANKHDIEGNYMKTFGLSPDFARRIGDAKREARFAGTGVSNWFRKPFGQGWALVGDAGYDKDPITAQGITDAFLQAELCATALDEVFSGARGFDDAMGDYQRVRDEQALPMYEFTTQLATLEPPPPEMQQLLGAVHGNQDAMDGFVGVTAGTVSPAEFFDPKNIGPIMGAAASAVPD
jgi:flavin-dependent dehydrogenase